MMQIRRGLLPETSRDQLSIETELPTIRTYLHRDGIDPIRNIDEEHNLEGEWIDIGGEG